MYDAYSRMEILLGQKGVNLFSVWEVQAPIQWKHWHDAGLAVLHLWIMRQ